MRHRDVVDQFHDDDRLADARAAEQSDFAASQVRLDQIDHLDAGFKHLRFRRLFVEGRRRNYTALANRLTHIDGARALRATLPEMAAPYVFPLYVGEPAASYQRLRSAGVPIFRWDETWPETPALDGDRGLDWADHVFQLGCHQDLSLQDIENIATTVEEVIRR